LGKRPREAARRWLTDSAAKADARRDEALRRIGAKILDEAIPQKLRQALDGERGEAELKPERRK
jgi:hypothetical protein